MRSLEAGNRRICFDIHVCSQLLIFFVSCLILFTRRPEAVLQAQFWAEDGRVWFADAYNHGWLQPFLHTQDGYFQTFPRLIGALAQLFPLAYAPLLFNLTAIAVQALAVCLILRQRSCGWGSLRYRAFLAGIYLALPNCWELMARLTDTQWILAFCAFLALVGEPAKGRAGRIGDLCLIGLSGATGPFCFFLLLTALYMYWLRRDRRAALGPALLLCFSLLQGTGLLCVNLGGRPHAPLGANLAQLFRVLGGQVFLSVLMGDNDVGDASGVGALLFLFCLTLGGGAVLAFAFCRAGKEMQALVLLALLILAASLLSPVAYPTPGHTRWQMLATASGVRYWFFPNLSFAWSILYLVTRKPMWARIVGGWLVVFLCVAIIRDWRGPLYPGPDMRQAQKSLEATPPGLPYQLAITPPGWTMTLIKRDSGR